MLSDKMSKISCLSYARLIIIAGLLPLHLCLSAPDPYFGTCQPEKCGNVSIAYPFRIISRQKTHCGYPGFEVSCHNDSFPALNIFGMSFIIRDISFKNRTVRVVNSVFHKSMESNCTLPGNVTWESDVLKIAHNKTGYTIVNLLYNCTGDILRRYEQDVVNCRALAVYEKELNDHMFDKCTRIVPLLCEKSYDSNSTLKETASRGVLLRWMNTNCSDCVLSGGHCGFNQTLSRFMCYCYDRPHVHQCPTPYYSPTVVRERRKKRIIIGSAIFHARQFQASGIWVFAVVAGASALVILVIVGVICILKKGRASTDIPILSSNGVKMENQNVEALLKVYGSPAPKRYTYAEVKRMTLSFKEKLGEGGYGSVYKGKLPHGRFVAVKLLKRSKDTKGEDFINEVASISRANHINIVRLKGYCFQKRKWALVYDFMPNGSLDKFVYSASTGHSLPWETLFSISIGIARGLDYLHRGCNTRILHFDIKPHNILLDEEFCPKISDFGLARLCLQKDSTISMFEARGTIGYIAPEVFCRNFGGISHKSDVYSYGMMVLDMVCGRKNVSDEIQRSSDIYFPQWIYNQLELGEEVAVEDGEIMNESEKDIQKKMIIVSLWCIQTYSSDRPSMRRVIEMLDGNIESLTMPPRPDQSCLPSLASENSGVSIIAS